MKLNVWIFCRLCDLRNECEQLEKEQELIMMKQQEDKGQEYALDLQLSDQELMMKSTKELNKFV